VNPACLQSNNAVSSPVEDNSTVMVNNNRFMAMIDYDDFNQLFILVNDSNSTSRIHSKSAVKFDLAEDVSEEVANGEQCVVKTTVALMTRICVLSQLMLMPVMKYIMMLKVHFYV